MGDALAILRRHLADAERARDFHRARGPRLGNFEAMVAALKIAWLKTIIADCGGGNG